MFLFRQDLVQSWIRGGTRIMQGSGLEKFFHDL